MLITHNYPTKPYANVHTCADFRVLVYGGTEKGRLFCHCNSVASGLSFSLDRPYSTDHARTVNRWIRAERNNGEVTSARRRMHRLRFCERVHVSRRLDAKKGGQCPSKWVLLKILSHVNNDITPPIAMSRCKIQSVDPIILPNIPDNKY